MTLPEMDCLLREFRFVDAFGDGGEESDQGSQGSRSKAASRDRTGNPNGEIRLA